MSQFQPLKWAPSQQPPDTRSYFPQMPVYQPPVMPQRKSHATRNVLLACLAVILVAVIVFVAIASRGSSSSVARIGDEVSSGSWNVTVNSVSSSRGTGFLYSPQAGNVYLIIDITLKNTAATAQTSSTTGQWKLRDAQGQTFDEDIFYSTHSPEGSIGPGQQVHGPIAYEVPQAIHSFTLQFIPRAGDTADLVQWNVGD
jgi:flagellar basal body-associated protein FliL